MGMFREERATHAREWVEYISTNFEKEINECIHKTFIVDRNADCDDIQVGDNHLGYIVMSKDSYVYNDDFKTRIAENRTDAHNSKLVLVDTDSVSAIFDFYKPDRKIAVLNFASFTHPGGKFYEGSIAQHCAMRVYCIRYCVLMQDTMMIIEGISRITSCILIDSYIVRIYYSSEIK